MVASNQIISDLNFLVISLFEVNTCLYFIGFIFKQSIDFFDGYHANLIFVSGLSRREKSSIFARKIKTYMSLLNCKKSLRSIRSTTKLFVFAYYSTEKFIPRVFCYG